MTNIPLTLKGMPMEFNYYGRNRKKRKEFVQQPAPSIVRVEVSKIKQDSRIACNVWSQSYV
jgi:hypothetical protein